MNPVRPQECSADTTWTWCGSLCLYAWTVLLMHTCLCALWRVSFKWHLTRSGRIETYWSFSLGTDSNSYLWKSLPSLAHRHTRSYFPIQCPWIVVSHRQHKVHGSHDHMLNLRLQCCFTLNCVSWLDWILRMKRDSWWSWKLHLRIPGLDMFLIRAQCQS